MDDVRLNRYSPRRQAYRRKRRQRPGEEAERAQEHIEGHHWRYARELAWRELLVADRRSADVAQLRPVGHRRGAGRAQAPRPDHDQVVLLLARLHARPVRDRRDDDGALRRLPGPAQRPGPADHPHLHRRPHVRRELGPRLARRQGPVRGRVAGRPAGLVRGGDGAPLRGPPGRRGLAGVQRDAAVRRREHRPQDRRHLGADHQGRGARGRRPPAVLARRRRLGHRGHRQRQRLQARRGVAARRLPRAAHLPGRRRPGPAALRRRRRLRAVRHLRQAGDHGGVRRQLRLRLRRQRRRVLQAPDAQHAAGGRHRLDRVEQHRLRAPAARTRTGTTRSSRTSGSPTPTARPRPRSPR